MDAPNISKTREILFLPLLPAQMEDALALLREFSPKIAAKITQNRTLIVEYDLREHTLMEIETHLIQKGFLLENNFWVRTNRALIYYAEEIERHNLEAPPPKLKRIPEIAFVQVFEKRHPKKKS